MLYRFILLVALSGCSTLEPMTGADQASWDAVDLQTKLYSTLTYMEQSGKNLFEKTVNESDSLLVVRITKGKAIMWPSGDRYQIKPTIFSLANNSCQTIRLSAKNDFSQATTLKSCYQNGELMLDPSRWNYHYKNGSIVIKSSPLWQEDGVVYDKLSSDGYTHLTDLSIDVHSTDANA